MSDADGSASPATRRIDQWLWFARLAKTRSFAARLCAAGAVTVNGTPLRKSNQPVRVGDAIAAPQGNYRRTVRILALGSRRGPASEAQWLYQEIAVPVRLTETVPEWEPLLFENRTQDRSPAGCQPRAHQHPRWAAKT